MLQTLAEILYDRLKVCQVNLHSFRLRLLLVQPNRKPDPNKLFNQHIIVEKVERMTKQVAHPMMKLQRQVSSLVQSKIVDPSDRIGKIALLLGNDWSYWKNELLDFDFSSQDSIQELLDVEDWDED